jgi:hypothetical protein
MEKCKPTMRITVLLILTLLTLLELHAGVAKDGGDFENEEWHRFLFSLIFIRRFVWGNREPIALPRHDDLSY